jgi:hypothetical protein
MGEVVFIDQGEMDKAPTAVREAFSKESGPIPQVALSNPEGTKVYGTSNHTALKGGLDKAMRDAKRAMRDDLSSNPSKPATTAAAKTASASESASSKDIKVTEKNGVKDVAGAPIEDWKSSKGTVITARLSSVSKYKITLVTDKGKTVTVNQSDLAADSFTRLQEIINPQ